MKRILTALLLTWMLMPMLAQQNPVPGFVITLQGDTLWGQLDLRMNTTNQKQCSFQKSGEPNYRTYLPGEIEGYRFTQNGKFYVSRTLEIEGEKNTLFAEFLVKGMLNLLMVEVNNQKYFYLENENGETALYAEDGKKEQNASELRAKTNSLSSVLLQSPTAMKDMRYGAMKQNQMIALARDYHQDLCTEGDMECMEFRYDQKRDRCKKEVRLVGGYRRDLKGIEYRNSTWAVMGVALDVLMKKRAKGMLIQAQMAAMPVLEDKKAYALQLSFGPGYRWDLAPHARPIVHGGISFLGQIDNRDLVKVVLHQHGTGNWTWNEWTWANSEIITVLPYAGIGIDIPVGHQSIVLYADLYASTVIFPQFTASWRIGKRH